MVFRASSGSRPCPTTELWGSPELQETQVPNKSMQFRACTVHPQFQLYFIPSALRASYQEELSGLAPGLGGHKDFNTTPNSILSLLALGLTRLVRRLGGLWQPIERASTDSGNLSQSKHQALASILPLPLNTLSRNEQSLRPADSQSV